MGFVGKLEKSTQGYIRMSFNLVGEADTPRN